ncbi:ankyrin repeat domain-containing protein [bacterium]|jgi:ankyrin repeat protein|nr:ankyrin repeat domain-containing protein [bacterium]|tara:strand:- start:17227 stop:18609 length:1383 start_codon:yes stop_codon:yes gene_type:complete
MSTATGPSNAKETNPGGFLTRAERADAFIDAAGLGHIVEVQRLIASGDVDVNACDEEESNTALLLASQNGRPMVVAALLDAGADVDAANNNGDTPLILASLNGHGHIVDALLRAGANVSAVDQFGSCALFYASRQGHCGLVDALLAAGADVNHARVTALLIASRFGHASALNKLLLAGADVSAVDDDGNTALHRCALETTPGAVYGGGIGEVVELLIKACADTTAKNVDGLTPLQLAKKGAEYGTSEWQKIRCNTSVETLELAEGMTVGLREWLRDAGLSNDWREFARLGAKEREDVDMLERDDLRRDKGSLLTPIQANRLFRAVAQGAHRADARHELDMGMRYEQFLRAHKLEQYINHFNLLGCAFERDLLDITEKQLELMVERHGLKILDKRRFAKAVAILRRKLTDDPSRSDSHARSGSEHHHVRVKREQNNPNAAHNDTTLNAAPAELDVDTNKEK